MALWENVIPPQILQLGGQLLAETTCNNLQWVLQLWKNIGQLIIAELL